MQNQKPNTIQAIYDLIVIQKQLECNKNYCPKAKKILTLAQIAKLNPEQKAEFNQYHLDDKKRRLEFSLKWFTDTFYRKIDLKYSQVGELIKKMRFNRYKIKYDNFLPIPDKLNQSQHHTNKLQTQQNRGFGIHIATMVSHKVLSTLDETLTIWGWKNARNMTLQQEYKQKLVLSNIKIVLKLVATLKKNFYGDHRDLMQAGIIGLTMAIETFQPEKDNKLMTFAQWKIMQQINYANGSNENIIRIPMSLRTLIKQFKWFLIQNQITTNISISNPLLQKWFIENKISLLSRQRDIIKWAKKTTIQTFGEYQTDQQQFDYNKVDKQSAFEDKNLEQFHNQSIKDELVAFLTSFLTPQEFCLIIITFEIENVVVDKSLINLLDTHTKKEILKKTMSKLKKSLKFQKFNSLLP